MKSGTSPPKSLPFLGSLLRVEEQTDGPRASPDAIRNDECIYFIPDSVLSD